MYTDDQIRDFCEILNKFTELYTGELENLALINKITFKNVISFTMPTIIMMVFMSVYQMVDGVFISNIIGTNALSAVNIVFPVISFLIGVSIMLGTGGSAIIAKNLGEDKPDKARRQFTLIILTGIVVGIVTAIIGVIFIDPGAEYEPLSVDVNLSNT